MTQPARASIDEAAVLPRGAGGAPAPEQDPSGAAATRDFRALFELGGIPLLLLDGHGALLCAAPGAHALLGYAPGALVGRSFLDLVHPDDRPAVSDLLRELAAAPGQTRITEQRCRHEDGSWRWIEGTWTPLLDHPEVRALVLLLHDVTPRRLAEQRLAEREQQWASLFQHNPDCIYLFDLDGRFLDANPACSRISGYSREELLQMAWMPLIVPEDLPRSWAAFRQAASGRPAAYEIAIRHKDGQRVDLVGTSFPMIVGDRIVGVFGVVKDVTAQKRAEAERAELLAREQAARRAAEAAEQRLSFLSAAGEALAASLDYETTLNQVVHLAVGRLADWCMLEVLEESAEPHCRTAHIDAAREALLRRFHPLASCPKAPLGLDRVLTRGEAILLSEITDAQRAELEAEPEQAALLRELGIDSAICVPLRARGRVLGALTLVSAGSGRRYGAEDLALAQELARRAALAIDNARLYRVQREIAGMLQASLLPPRLPSIPRAELAATYRPAGEGIEVGGDFFDVFETPDGAWALVIGDVTGKGPAAAALTALVRHTLYALTVCEVCPSRILATLNETILRRTPAEKLCTVVYLRLQWAPEGARLLLAAAGHPLPLRLRPDGAVEAIGCHGRLLGAFADFSLDDATALLRPGDTLLLYTDGVTDAVRDGRLFGEEALVRLLSSCAGESPAAIVERIERAVLDFQGGLPRDDLALLALRVTG